MNIKKSAVDLTDLAIGIVVLGVVVTIGSTILITTRDSRLTDLTLLTTNNESLSFTGSTATLTNKWGQGVTTVYNATGGGVIPPANYTTSISQLDGTVTITNLTNVGQPWNATYKWYNTSSRVDYGLADDAAVGIGEYGNWFKIIVIVGVAAVVLSLIFMAFGRKEGGGTAY